MRILSGRLANLGPERLTAILNRAEEGYLDDWADLCDRMVEVDATIRASYETRLAAIAGARWYVEAGTPTGDRKRDAQSAAAVAFVQRAIQGIPGLEVAIQESLDGVGKGLAAHEIEWAWDGTAMLPKALHWVHARRFRWDRDTWTLRLVDDGSLTSAFGEELQPDGWIVHAPKTVAGYPTRIGALRAVAWPYLFRRWCVQFWVQGAESFAWPFLWAEVPRGATDDVRAVAKAGLEVLSTEHRGVAEEGTAFRLLETTVKDGGTWDGLFRALGGEIGKALLGMTDLNEPSRIGAYAAVEIRRGTTVDARIAMDERAISTTWTQQLIEPLLRFNAHLFGGAMPPVPRIHWSVAAQRREIPQHLLPFATEDEIRASIDLDPKPVVEDVAPAADVAATALNGAQVSSLQGLLAAIAEGSLSSAAAKVAIKNAFPTIAQADVDAMVDAQAEIGSAKSAPLPAITNNGAQ
jgi:phage gp29-like protein